MCALVGWMLMAVLATCRHCATVPDELIPQALDCRAVSRT